MNRPRGIEAMAFDDHVIIMRDAARGCWLEFTHPLEVLEIHDACDVVSALVHIEQSASRLGLHAAGMVAYEAAPAFDPSLAMPEQGPFPLLWFGLFREPRRIVMPPISHDPETTLPEWRATVHDAEYQNAFSAIKSHLFQGDIYQVNYTYRLESVLTLDPWPFFVRMCAAQGASYGAFIRTHDRVILSASPELFFSLDGDRLISRPMKGTIERGRTWQQDREHARRLLVSQKERAENLMIVDMVRNDLGRIAAAGSVAVPLLFELEKYPTLWQMTSTVVARTAASLTEILQALFPAASITGAPKHRAMQIIAGLENTPRQIYTGSIGFLAPGRRAQFNVAIRTVAIDRSDNAARYGVGGGIVWDSVCEGERRECRVKALVLSAPAERFCLFETIRWTPREGYCLLGRHLLRIARSAAYFDYPIDMLHIRRRLKRLALDLPPRPHKVRLLLSQDGEIACQADEILMEETPSVPRVALAPYPIDPCDTLLYHKTTRRRVYNEALDERPGFEDVILYNTRGEVTESTIANIVADLDGEMVTPPLESGLLPGTLRGWMLDKRLLREQALSVERLLACPRLFLINSVRGMYQVSLDCYRKSLHVDSARHEGMVQSDIDSRHA